MLTEVEGREFPERQAEPEPQEREWWGQEPGPGRELALPTSEPRGQEQVQVQVPRAQERELASVLQERAWEPEQVLPSSELLERGPELASVPQELGLARVPEQQEQERVRAPGLAQAPPFSVPQEPERVLGQEQASERALAQGSEPQPLEPLVRERVQAPELEPVPQQAFLPSSSRLPGQEQERPRVQQQPSTPSENRAPPGWRWRACAPSQVQRLWQAQESHHASDRTSQRGRPVQQRCLL